MDYTRLKVSQAGAVLTVTLNRPEAHNAFEENLLAELTHCFLSLQTDETVRVVILCGEGASFCAGADLDWMRRMAGYTPEENREDARALQRMFAAIAACPKVIIARIQGAAIGGGAGLAAVCDLAIAVPEAKFAFSEVRLGIAPAVIAPYVVRKIGYGAAQALFVTGERFGAEEAMRLGLVQQVVPAETLDAAVQRKVESVLQSGPNAIRTVKQLLHAIEDTPPEEAAERTVECIAQLRVSPEGQEGLSAFLEKRRPGYAQEGN